MSMFQDLTFPEVLQDLQCRFLINIPDEELMSPERIFFQIEQAHWYYEDFVREANPAMATMSLKLFSAHMFWNCELLQRLIVDFRSSFRDFVYYKVRVPVCGAIILSSDHRKCLLVRGFKAGSNWGFPKGKINKEEAEHRCAAREVLEETGFDIASRLNPDHYLERTIREQRIRLYVIQGVPEDAHFQTQTRKEIGAIRWFPLTNLPGW
ncbi:hypothetical protein CAUPRSCDRAFT_8947, partial [Caulochytrium protostelioides]